jgi:hypothetical protein
MFERSFHFSGQKHLQLGNERWQLRGDGLPHRIQVDVRVTVNKPVPHVGHVAPGNFWIPGPHWFGNSPCGLLDYFQQAYEREPKHHILVQLRTVAAFGEFERLFNGLDNVVDPDDLVG